MKPSVPVEQSKTLKGPACAGSESKLIIVPDK